MRSSERLKPAVQAKKKSTFFRKAGEGDFFGGQQQQQGHFFTGRSAGKGGKGVVQKKLKVGQPGDIYEKEADSMAENVVQKCAQCEAEEKKGKGKVAGGVESIQRKPIFESKNEPKEEGMVNRKCSACAAEEAKGGVSESVEARLKASKGGGSPLPASERKSMEAGFGADFGSVRIHQNDGAAKMSEELGAHAFTHGNDIYFN